MHRNQARSTWVRKGLAFTVAAVVASTIAGALLGVAGHLLSESVRSGLIFLLGMGGVLVALGEFFGHPVKLLQWNRETPQLWLNKGPLRWAVRNGITLGVGATSRIGFWLWYVVPLGALLSRNWLIGGAIYGLYGLLRASGTWALILSPQVRRVGLDRVAVALVDRIPLARSATRTDLLLLGIACAYNAFPWA